MASSEQIDPRVVATGLATVARPLILGKLSAISRRMAPGADVKAEFSDRCAQCLGAADGPGGPVEGR